MDCASATIDDYMNDQSNAETVAPRALAVPGGLFVNIDDTRACPCLSIAVECWLNASHSACSHRVLSTSMQADRET